MIQRIQTIYLLVTTILTGLMIKLPFLMLMATDGREFILNGKGVIQQVTGALVYPAQPIVVYIIITLLLVVTSIFMFKKRTLQIRLVVYNMILMVGFYALLWFFYTQFANAFDVNKPQYAIAITFPLINMVLLYLALNAIRRDESLIKAMDRLR